MIDVLLLIALPASGKSELRRYLDHLDADTRRRDFHVGHPVDIDDYPYVHLMRVISRALRASGRDGPFFGSDEAGFADPADWLTLIHLINDDAEAAISGGRPELPPSTVFPRLEKARAAVGAPPPFAEIGEADVRALAAEVDGGAPSLDPIPAAADGDTIVIEFARGGPEDAALPLPRPHGYTSSLGELDDWLMAKAAALYVWVEPEESRRRNRERALPGGAASILHHGVPDTVMVEEYGTDDISWLESQARRPGTIPVRDHDVPFARFDNRIDRTSFLRGDPEDWSEQAVDRLHADLRAAFGSLVAR